MTYKRYALGPAGRRFGDGGAEHPLGNYAAAIFEQREEDLTVRVLAQGGGDPLGELLDLLHQRLDRCDQGEGYRITPDRSPRR